MRVGEVMSRGVQLVPPDLSVRDAAVFMAEHDVGAALVGEGDGPPVGILTDRDIILRVVISGDDPGRVRVGDVMSSTLFTCREDDDLEAALHEMDERQVRRLPVLDAQGKIAGIVARSDITHRLLGERTASAASRPELDAPTPADGP